MDEWQLDLRSKKAGAKFLENEIPTRSKPILATDS